MSSEARDFIPGACATGPAEPVFSEVDRGSRDGRLIILAQAACRSCLQLPHCEEQRAGIAEELRARGIERTVIGAVALETPAPAEEKTPPKDTTFTFNLQYPLTEPRHMLEVIRQGFRAGQLATAGARPAQYDELSSHLTKRLASERGGFGLDTNEVEIVAHIVSRSFLKYRLALHSDGTRKQQRAPLSVQERRAAVALQEVFAEDVAILKKVGFLDPETLAQMHKPDFYDKIVQIYNQRFGISPGNVRDLLRKYTLDPIPAIERYIARNQPKQPVAIPSRPGKKALTELQETPLLTERIRALMRDHFSWSTFTRHLPELKNYLWTICQNNLIDPDREVKEVFFAVKTAQGIHPEIESAVLVHLAYYQRENLQDAIETYETVLLRLHDEYPAHPALSDKRLRRLAFTHLENAPTAVEEYLERLSKLQETCAEADSSLPKHFLYAMAENHKRHLTATELEALYKRSLLSKRSVGKLPGIERWIVGKVIELYEHDEAVEVLGHISRFRRRGHLVVAQMKSRQDTLPTWYDPVDSKKGTYLALSEQLSSFSREEQEAILASFNLDRIVLGYDVNKERICTLFGLSSLDQLVDEYLLPYTRPIDVDFENPHNLLHTLRYLRRDEALRTKQVNVQEEVDKKLTILLSQLAKENIRDHDLASPACRAGLRRMLSQLRVAFPIKFKRRSLVPLAMAYLEDAQRIKELGCAHPYGIALGYSGAFCEKFVVSIDSEDWNPSKHQLSKILQNNTTGQAVVALRQYQQLARHLLPHFKNRKIGIYYLKNLCMSYIDDPEGAKERLSLYDQMDQHFSVHTMTEAIHHYCFSTTSPDPVSEIKEWRRAAASVGGEYRSLLGSALIKQVALKKRGEKLLEDLGDRVKLFKELLAFYAQNPHPAIDEEVIRQVVCRPTTAKNQLKAHIRRWDLVHKSIDTVELDTAVVRRLVILNTTDPIESIKKYKAVREEYSTDDYIEASMIDEALKWSIRRAIRSIEQVRRLLVKTNIKKPSLDEKQVFKRGGFRPMHDIVADAKNPEAGAAMMSSLVDPVAPTREQSQLMKLLSRLPNKECAAVAAVYQIPWLLPQPMQDDGWGEPDKVCDAFGVRTLVELEPIVETILAKLRS